MPCTHSGSASKKTPYAPQRDRPDVVAEREKFAKVQGTLPAGRLVFVDETGLHPGIGPRCGWAKRGEILSGPDQSYARGQHVSLVAAMSQSGITAQMTVEGGVKGADFLRFVVDHLVPTLRPGDMVLWDNIAMHLNHCVIDAVESTGAGIVRLPRYSPDLNPIEAAWAKVKRRVRRLLPKTVPQLKRGLSEALARVTPSDAAGWFRYCGFRALRF